MRLSGTGFRWLPFTLAALLLLAACGRSESDWRSRIPDYLAAGPLLFAQSWFGTCAVFAFDPASLPPGTATGEPLLAALNARWAAAPDVSPRYDGWHATPMLTDYDMSVLAHGFSHAADCLTARPELKQILLQAADQPNAGVYTADGGHFLLLVPEERVMIVALLPR